MGVASLVPAALRPRYWNLKRTTILVGFVPALLGSLGGLAYVEPVEKASAALDDEIRASAVALERIRSAINEYTVFDQQGSLIIGLSSANTNDDARGTIGNLTQIALIDRTFAMREIIGQLAMRGRANYRQTSDEYAAIVDTARHDLTIANYLSVKTYENGFVARAQTLSNELQSRRYALARAKSEADRQVGRRKLVLLVLASLGSTFLLAANLVATKEAASAEAGNEKG